VAEDSLGAELIDEGKLQEAISHFQTAAVINPRDAFSRLNLGVCQKRMGSITAAAANYEAALQLSSDRNLRATAFGNLGSIYRVRGDYPRARASFESALALLPDYSLALTGMGLVAQKTGDSGTAATYFARAAKAAPSDTEFLLLSQALAKAGHEREAQTALAQAQAMSQNWSSTVQMVNHLLLE
jgi:Flp pilus assembly protein TadD